MDDQELNAVLKRYSGAWRRYMSRPAMQGEKPALPAQAQAAINKLQAEANRVPDPGGPLTNYSAALAGWAAANHPDIDSMEMSRHILDKLVLDHR
ncbi:MAG: hypothetical protein ACLGH7_09105 [Actinomycetes bacterium]